MKTSDKVNELGKAYEALKQSENKYHMMFEHANAGIAVHEVILDKNNKVVDYTFVDINPAYEKMTGLKKGDVIGKRVREVIPNIEDKWFEIYGKVALTGKSISFVEHSNFLNRYWTIRAFSPQKNQFAITMFDITEQINAQKELEKSEETFRYAMEASADGIWDWDIQRNKVFYSPGWNNILGTKKLNPDLSTLEKHLHPDDRDRVLNSLNTYLEGSGENWEDDYRLRHHNGNWTWIKGKGKVVEYDNAGKPKRMVGTATNIDEKRRAEKQMEEQKILLDSIIDQSPFPTFICDKTGVMVRVNDALLDTLNYKREQLVGVYNVLNDINMIEQGIMPLIKKVFKDKHTAQFTQYWKKDLIGIDIGPGGKDLYNDVTLFPILNKNDDLEYVVCQWIEITDQVLAQKALEESEKKYRFLVENQNDLIVTINTQSHITFANPSYCRIFGVKEEEILNRSFIPLIHKDDLEKVKNSINNVLKPPYTSYHEERAKTVNGWRWFEWSLKANFDGEDNVAQIVALGRDITDRKNIEFEIEQLSRFPSENPNPVLRISKNGSILYSNPSSNDLLTVITNKDNNTVISRWQKIITQALSVNTPIQEEIDVGSMIYAVNIVPVEKHDYVNLYLNNITEVKKAEEDKFASEKRFKELVNTINSGVAVYKVINDGKSGNDYIIQDFNKTALELEKRQDVIGKSLKDIRPNIDEYGLIEIFRKVWETGKPAFYPAKLYQDNKYASYYENRVFRLPSNEIVAVYDDVTEKTHANMKLRESEERFELAMKASKDGLYDWNLITNEIYYSPGYKAMLGYKYDELPNDFSVWETLTDPDDVKQSWEMQRKLVSGEIDRFEIEFRMKHKKGHWVDILSRAEVVRDENGKAVRMIGTHVDISEQKKNQNDLIKAMNQARESDRLKSAFLANMSHEIRTPMNGILGFSSLLKQHDFDLEKRKEYIDIILQSGKRMLNTINDLIDISKIEAGQIEVRNSYMNLNDKMAELYQFFLPEAKKKSLKFSYQTALKNEDAKIYTDEEKIHAIMTNFINNALKFTDQGYIEFGYHMVHDQIEFFVKDTGRGINKEYVDKIFDRFIQADLSLTRAYEGSGLGLSISKAYAELMNGNIRVESIPRKGSTFYITLPLTDKNFEMGQHYKHGNPLDNHTSKKLNILLVEDDETSVVFMKALLENYCHSMLVARTGSEAIKTVEDHPDIDLILMDVRMPDMDGYSATKKIREFNQDVLIIAQTAYAMESDRIKAMEAGCNSYISKPINEEKLFELISEIIK